MTRIILVRHGQTAWNRDERFRGHADVPLDETGFAQAQATATRMAAEWKLDALPVFDGLIAADGRLFLSTADGKVRCFTGKGGAE